MNRLLFARTILLICPLLLSQAVWANSGQLRMLETMLEKSRPEVEASNNAAAREQLAQAEALLEKAKQLAASGDDKGSKVASQQLVATLLAARQGAQSPAEIEARARALYNKRENDFLQMRKNYMKMTANSAETGVAETLIKQAEDQFDKAQALAGENRWSDAAREMDAAFASGKTANIALRERQ
jgi:hypothetical protein